MRSTRQKMRLLRGISRSHTTGGSSLNVRKSSGSNNHNGNSNQHNFQQQHQANGNGSIANGNRTATTSAENNQNLAFSQSNGQVFNGNGNHSSGSAEGRTGRQRPQQKSQQQSVARSGAIRSLSTSSFSSISSSSSSSSSSTRKSTQNQNGHQSSPDHSSPDLLVANPAAHGIGHLFENGITLNNSFLSAASSSFGIGHPSRQWTQFLATNMDSTGLNSDIREKAFGICRDYLHGAWKQIDSKDLVIKRVSGGLSNWLYHCSLPLTLTPQHNEPAQVLLRFYGQVHGEGALESLITESVIFTLLSERKLGPRLYGVFPGGRVEEFIPARPLQTEELRDAELSLQIAQKTAQIHGLNIPISKEPSWLWGTMERWMCNVRECFAKPPELNECKTEILHKLINYNLEGELAWLKTFLPKINSPVVFAHNDLQEGNILIRPEFESVEDKLALIDFEYCSYNYRGFDLANHFCEWSYNYNVEVYPNFAFTPKDLPSQEEMLRFIRRYIHVLREEYQMNFTDYNDEFLQTNPLFDEDHILHEIQAFTLASHFFWSLWAVVNAQVSKIPFGYWEYGLCRLESYFNLKKTLV